MISKIEVYNSKTGHNYLRTLKKVVGYLAPFVNGGLSGMLATMIIQPLDTLKVQVQIMS
jgi:hypothetical protein